MIRIYFDSDVINNIRSGNLSELKLLLDEHREKLLIPYSHAHINDKLSSKSTHEDLFWRDIDYLSEFSQEKILIFHKEKGEARSGVGNAREVYGHLEYGLELLDEFSDINNIVTFLDKAADELEIPELSIQLKELMDTKAPGALGTYKDQLQQAADRFHYLRIDSKEYKKARNKAWERFKLPSHSFEWKDGVVNKIDEHLKANGDDEDFMSKVENSFDDKDKITRFSFYISAYLMLNQLGYRADGINVKAKRVMENHIQDATHSFFGANCDIFVVKDKKLKSKTKALYERFNIQTKVVETDEFLIELRQLLKPVTLGETIKDIQNMCLVDTLVEEGIYKALYRLNRLLLGYFTHIQIEEESNLTRVLFTKMYTTYSEFMFYQEHDTVIREVDTLFGGENTDAVIKEFKESKEPYPSKEYLVEGVYAKLTSDGGKFYLNIAVLKNPSNP